MGASRAAQDSETSPVWELSSSSLTHAPSLTSDSEGKKPAQAAKKEPKKNRVSLCSPGCPGTHSVDQAGLELRNLPASAYRVLGLQTESWFSRWLPGKKRTEAYLPDDKNKSIVWDEKKNQWVNLNEPEEEKKAPPPPPASFPRIPQVAPTGPAGPPTASVNVFSRKAGGSRARYVDVLNPSGTQRSEPALAPADFFAPLAPLPIPSNLFVPNTDTEEPQPADGTGCRGQAPAGTQSKAEPTLESKVVSSTESAPGPELLPSKPDGSQGGELSRCSSLSSLSQEVSRHFHQMLLETAVLQGPLLVALCPSTTLLNCCRLLSPRGIQGQGELAKENMRH
ncbi:Protein transport protein sec16 [Apodemus speciosus]|uniref:Protein transport protein sec16 n=1 Tax=Apodemus speciosus TaxID=105296 RepID=A0ABQ0EG97_APOSI